MYTTDSQPAMGAPGYRAPGTPAAGSGGGDTSGTYYAPPSGSIGAAEDYTTAQNAYNRALIRYNQQRQSLLRSAGYKATIDPTTGAISGMGVDVSNPYGQLQQLYHNQAIEDQNSVNAAEDRGIFGGLAHQGESELRYQHGAQDQSLVSALMGGLGDLDNQQADAKATLDAALWQLQHQATTDAIDNGDYNPADPGDTGGGGGNGGGMTAPVSHTGLTAAQKTAINTAAVKKGQPISEHGLGSLGNTRAKTVAKIVNAYTTGQKKRG